jgi:hypothetical protein
VIEYLITLAIEEYGPIGMLAVLLWYRQGVLISAVLRLADEQPGVDQDSIRSDLPLRDD